MEFILAVFAAGGVCLFLWCLMGIALRGTGEEGTLIYCIQGDADNLERYLRWIGWLCRSGFLQVRIVLVDCGLSELGRRRALFFLERDPGVADLCRSKEQKKE